MIISVVIISSFLLFKIREGFQRKFLYDFPDFIFSSSV
jgi:hypothetical protein